MTLADFETQVNLSLAPRTRLKELNDQMVEQMTMRDDADYATIEKILAVVAGIVADPTEGANSALYEACGYVRKDNRKSGLTRKRTEPNKTKVLSRG